MHIYVSVDMEGASGVTRWQDVITTGQDYGRARSWMTGDVNAAVDGARRAGAERFVVEENHGVEMLTNLLLDEIDPDVDVVRGLPRGGATTIAALDDSFDALFLVAHHAKAGDRVGFCAHTISYESYRQVRVNGRPVGEGEIFAVAAAQVGVPAALITGDDVVCAEMAKVCPGIETAVVKQAMSRTGGRIVPPQRAWGTIRDAAERATARVAAGDIGLVDVDPTFEVEVELREAIDGAVAESIAEHHPEFSVEGDRTLVFRHDEMAVAYRMMAISGMLAESGRVRGW